MSEVKYFEREYNYLQIAGEEFSKKHQAIGGYLRLDDRHRKDPFVERLLEAFAFLSGRIHERLDDDIPEFAGTLLEQLFPHFLRPFPSCAILQARPTSGAITKPLLVKRGSEIQTPVGRYQVKYRVSASPLEKGRTLEKSEPAEFIFRTTQDLTVLPMRLRSVRIEDDADGKSALILQFQPNRNVTYEALALNRLALYLGGSYRLKYTLLLYLTAYAESLAVREVGPKESPFGQIKPFYIGIPELTRELHEGEERALVPYARQIFYGYRLLQEYFAFPERFFFIEIEGLQQFKASGEGHPFEIKIGFDRALSREFKPTEQDILINCAPIINLFDRPTEPVAVSRRLPEYYMIPDADRRKSREIYSLNKVTGVDENRSSQYSYTPITSYDILDLSDPEYEFKRFYSAVFRPVTGDMGETSIRLFGPSMAQEDFPKETLSIQATVTNGFLPAQYLQVGSISEATGFPEGLEVFNLTAPHDVLPCPERQNFLWALISHLTISYTTLAETNTLKTLLSLYNWSPSEKNPNRKKIREGIVNVHPPVARKVYRNRGLIRGIEFKIDINARQFENGEGDIHLFGLVLNRFLAQYLTINSFVMLKFVDVETNKEYKWEPNPGKILPV